MLVSHLPWHLYALRNQEQGLEADFWFPLIPMHMALTNRWPSTACILITEAEFHVEATMVSPGDGRQW